MPKYVLLMKVTQGGAQDLEDMPRHLQRAVHEWEELGGTLLGLYATMGDYDFVILGEAESCRKAAIFALRLTQRVDVQLTTMRAFGEGEIPGLWTDAFPDPVPPYPSMHVSPAAGGD